MKEYSGFIVNAMRYIDGEILTINPNSVDRMRLHNSIHRFIVINVKRLIVLPPEESRKALDYIYKTQLVNEMAQTMKEKTS